MCPQLHDLETRYSIAPVYSLFALDASTGLPAKNPSLAYGAITPTTLGCKAVQEGHASILTLIVKTSAKSLTATGRRGATVST